jgi:carbamoyltransferase
VVPGLYSEKMEAVFGRARAADEPLTDHHRNLAASVQKMLEETVFHILKALKIKTGENNLCVAGGVAQNSVTNGKITRRTGFEQVYIPAAGHDAGLAIGAAMYVYHQVLNRPRNQGMHHAYTGSRFTESQIQNLLEQKGIAWRKYADAELYETVAERIAQGGVIGWFRGRSEFGPRALGNRSILADPRRQDAKELLNRKIKRRESFRPFAPSVLREYAGEYFEYFEEAPFMEKVFQIKQDKRAVIPAVTHVDGSGRIQTVCRENNMSYYELIDTFRRKTGVPILLNTSFNENEPIVDSPEEALACFERTSMDMLVLENFVITRQPEQL